MKANRGIVGGTYYQAGYDPAAQQILPPPRNTKHDPIVYYMRLDRLIKIGMTTDLHRRVSAITPQGVLAVEFGGRGLEERRHMQFRAMRSHNEWFWLQPQLGAHIAEVREALETSRHITTEDWLAAHYVYPPAILNPGMTIG